MLERTVRINGTTYVTHDITGVDYDFTRNVATIRVTSYSDTENHTTWVPVDLSLAEGKTRAELYDVVFALPEFEPYVNDDTERLNQVMSVLTDEQLESFSTDFFPEWKADTYYSVGVRVSYSRGLFRCISAHNSQADWTPDATPSLWATVRAIEIDPNIIEEWVQPDSTNPYMTGDKVLHNGVTWISLVDNNVWEPGIVGTESLWQVFTDDGESSDEDTPTPEPEPEEDDVQQNDEPVGYSAWTQPDSNNPYMTGDIVEHNNTLWRCVTDNNVWEPGVYGWETINVQ